VDADGDGREPGDELAKLLGGVEVRIDADRADDAAFDGQLDASVDALGEAVAVGVDDEVLHDVGIPAISDTN